MTTTRQLLNGYLGSGHQRYAAATKLGPTGFDLYRHLAKAGITCEVIAPGLVPRKAADRIKTDRRDARKLASLYAGGLLDPVFVPSTELEAVRDLIRTREDARIDRMRVRQRLGALLMRHGRVMPTTFWGKTRRRWLGQQQFDLQAQQQAFDDYLFALDQVDHRILALEKEIEEVAGRGDWAELVGNLRCFRGIDTLAALGLVAEIGNFSRFQSAEQFMAFVGLVPSESSSGQARRQGSITKTGNGHARRLLIEAAWNARRKPKISYGLNRRHIGQDPTTIERAWRCQKRLYTRWMRMCGRGKLPQKTVVACARELAGFIWAEATDQPLKSPYAE